MFVNKTKRKLAVLSAVFLTLGFTACAKKAAGVKAQVKSQSNLNSGVSSTADQQAANLNANYKIASVSVPNQTSSGYTVDVELQTPSGTYLPVTTRHENGNNDSQGVYNDAQRNLQVYVNARCSSDNCFKYVLLVTVVRSNQGIYQSMAISYKNDCKFNYVSSTGTVGEFYTSLDQAINGKYGSVSATNDCSN